MISLDNEIRLANLLIALGEGESEVEEAREKLARHHEFDPYILYRQLDRTNKGYITVPELHEYFK